MQIAAKNGYILCSSYMLTNKQTNKTRFVVFGMGQTQGGDESCIIWDLSTDGIYAARMFNQNLTQSLNEFHGR